MQDIGRLDRAELQPLEPPTGGAQRRRGVRVYKVTAGGRSEDRDASQDRRALVRELAALVGAADIEIALTIDEDTGQTMIVLTERGSGCVIGEVTPQELLKAASAAQHHQGLFVNKKQ